MNMICELCDGTDFVKQDGFFVCQDCGCKYSLEEARKIMNKNSNTSHTDSKDAKSVVDPLLDLAFDMISKYINGVDENGREISINKSEYLETRKYLDQVEEKDPGNWKLWFYKGILEELANPTFYPAENLSSFYYFENAMKFADDNEKRERILPVIERLKQLIVKKYIDCSGQFWSNHEYYPVFLTEYMRFYNKFEIAASYAQKTSDDWDNLMIIAEERKKGNYVGKESDLKRAEEAAHIMDEYKKRMIKAKTDIILGTIGAEKAELSAQIKSCGIFDGKKKEELERKYTAIRERAKEAKQLVKKISDEAYEKANELLEDQAGLEVFWKDRFEHGVDHYLKMRTDYIKGIIKEPTQEDEEELKESLRGLGFYVEDYLRY